MEYFARNNNNATEFYNLLTFGKRRPLLFLQILCAISHILATVVAIIRIKEAFDSISLNRPTSVLYCLEVLMGGLYRLSVAKSLWRNGHLVVRILNCSIQDPLLASLQLKSKVRGINYIKQTFLT